MSEEQLVIEKDIVPNPEEYTLVKYSEVVVFFMIISCYGTWSIPCFL